MTPRESPEVFCTFIKSSIDHLYEVFKSVFNRTSCQSAGLIDSHSAKALKNIIGLAPNVELRGCYCILCVLPNIFFEFLKC